MKLLFSIAMLPVFFTNEAFGQTFLQTMCSHPNQVHAMEVRSNPDGYYIPELQVQLSFGDTRIVHAVGSNYLMCMSGTAQGAIDAGESVKYLFVPVERCKKKANRT